MSSQPKCAHTAPTRRLRSKTASSTEIVAVASKKPLSSSWSRRGRKSAISGAWTRISSRKRATGEDEDAGVPEVSEGDVLTRPGEIRFLHELLDPEGHRAVGGGRLEGAPRFDVAEAGLGAVWRNGERHQDIFPARARDGGPDEPREGFLGLRRRGPREARPGRPPGRDGRCGERPRRVPDRFPAPGARTSSSPHRAPGRRGGSEAVRGSPARMARRSGRTTASARSTVSRIIGRSEGRERRGFGRSGRLAGQSPRADAARQDGDPEVRVRLARGVSWARPYG